MVTPLAIFTIKGDINMDLSQSAVQSINWKDYYLTSSAIHFLVRTYTQKHPVVAKDNPLFWQVELLIQLRLLTDHAQGKYIHLGLTPLGKKLIQNGWQNKVEVKELLHKKDILSKIGKYTATVLLILGSLLFADLISFSDSILLLELFLGVALLLAGLASFAWDYKHALTYHKVSLQDLLDLTSTKEQKQKTLRVLQHASDHQAKMNQYNYKFFDQDGLFK